jgi:recombination protein RecA
MADSLEKVLADITKTYGPGIVMTGKSAPLKIDAISTGSLSLDMAIGIGGVPRGRFTILVGPESVGKGTVAQHIVAEAQTKGGIGAWIDAEHALDRKYAEACGMNVDDLILCQPDYGEQALEVGEQLVRSGQIAVLVIDSVAALVPRAELEGTMEDMQVGAQARMMSKALRKLAAATSKSNTAVLLLNQIRSDIGKFSPHGTPETSPGGRALRHAASVIMDIRKVEEIKDGKEVVGIRSRCRIKKNKVAPPLKEAIIEIYYGRGIDRVSDVVQVGIDLGTITKSGSWLTFGETRWHGREEATMALRNDPEMFATIEAAIRGEK